MTETCPKHGPYQAKRFRVGSKPLVTACPKCEAEKNEEAEKRETRGYRRAQQGQAMDGAGVPKRFHCKTLDTYRAETNGQKEALAWASEYARRFDEVLERGTCMIFTGTVGTGKTHLACGIVLEVTRAGHTAHYATVPEMLARVKETFRDGATETESQVLAEFAVPELLVLDEAGVQIGSDFEHRLFFRLLDQRYRAVLPTVLVSNLTVKELDEFLGVRVMDRLFEDGGSVVAFDWKSHRR